MPSTATPSPPQPPLTFDATPESLVGDAKTLIAATKHTWDSVVNSVRPIDATFDNTIHRIIQDENEKSITVRALRFYASTNPLKQLRDASGVATTLLNEAEVDLHGRIDMFKLVDSVLRKVTSGQENLDPEARCYLTKLHRKFKHNGCGITDPAAKARFEAAQKRLRDVQRQCSQNLHEEKTGLWLTLEELEGVPRSKIDRFRKGTDGDHEGMYWISTKVPFAGAVTSNAKREATRRKVYYAQQNRAPESVPLFRELILLRDETARLIGYPNHAALKTAEKMVQTPEFVTKLLAEIGEQLIPAGREEMTNLTSFKAAEAQTNPHVESPSNIFVWDQTYYANMRNEAEDPPNAQSSGYFELQATLSKLLGMFEHLFGTHFVRINEDQQADIGRGRALTWHEDVQMYSVWNSDEPDLKFLGFAYFDFYPRDGKYTHGGHYSLQNGFDKPDGTRFYSSSAVVMNYSEPSDTEPSLLGIQDVRKLFHEIGHLIHALCIETKYATSGYVDRDFVEVPSLTFEEFFWQEQHVRDVSCHYSYLSPAFKDMWRRSLPEDQRDSAEQPPAQLDAEGARALLGRGRRRRVRDQLMNLFFSMYDMAVHTPASHEKLEKTNLTEMFNKMRVDVVSLHGGEAIGDGWEWGHGESVFRATVNSYDAGYYSYVLGRLFALDGFRVGFESDTMSREAGRRYRDMVLRPGGSLPEMGTWTAYLGRNPSPRPYFEYLGLDPRVTSSTV